MQLSAANLLLAAQQSAKPQPQSAASGFAAALSGQQKTQSFAPIDFKQPAKAAPARVSDAPGHGRTSGRCDRYSRLEQRA